MGMEEMKRLLPDQANTELSVITDELRATRTESRSQTIADGPGGTNEGTGPVLPCTAEYHSHVAKRFC
jgi:hypothetical protein